MKNKGIRVPLHSHLGFACIISNNPNNLYKLM